MPTNLYLRNSPPTDLDLEMLQEAQLDITGAAEVEVVASKQFTGGVLHVNVNGVCVLRICRIKHLSWENARS